MHNQQQALNQLLADLRSADRLMLAQADRYPRQVRTALDRAMSEVMIELRLLGGA